MAATGSAREQREARERARVYRARQQMHEKRGRRRRRDNLVAGLAGGALILAVVGGQFAYYTVGPGGVASDPTPTVTPTPDRVVLGGPY